MAGGAANSLIQVLLMVLLAILLALDPASHRGMVVALQANYLEVELDVASPGTPARLLCTRRTRLHHRGAAVHQHCEADARSCLGLPCWLLAGHQCYLWGVQ